MSDIKVLALDLDGTLTNDQKLVTPRTRAALDAAIEKGVTIVDRVMVDALLHDRDNPRAIRGVVGFHGVSGEMHVVRARAVVLTAGAQ